MPDSDEAPVARREVKKHRATLALNVLNAKRAILRPPMRAQCKRRRARGSHVRP